MPNWCHGDIHFYGIKQNVERLYTDIQSALRYEKNTGWINRVNMWYFLEKTGFSPRSYLDTSNNIFKMKNDGKFDKDRLDLVMYLNELNFRAHFTDCYVIYDEYGMMGIHVGIDSAWDLDQRLLFLISKRYEVIYDFYLYEPGMAFAGKGHYGFVPPIDDNYIMTAYKEWECGEEEYDYDWKELFFYDLNTLTDSKKDLEQDKYECTIIPIDIETRDPLILGMYYEDMNCIPGMVYEIEIK